ncbi:MAG: hypothetical protein HYV28_08695 [Ignavibacteriales bacterium]|nr:hypothetical protein [Ignavibacteriales bacterium]
MNLLTLIKKHLKGVLFILFLLLLENVAWIIEPTLFGNVIDAFIAKADKNNLEAQLAHIFPLLVWVGVYLINSGSGTLRRLAEPSVFQRMYVEIVSKVAEMCKSINLKPNRAAARVQMSEEYVTFMQYRVPEIFEQVISISGAIIALCFFDWRIAMACLFIAGPMFFLGNLYTKKVVPMQSELHDTFEHMYDTFASHNPQRIKRTFASIANINTSMAKWGALNFGVIRLILLIIFILVLYIAIDLNDFTTGSIYSIVAYLWTFVASVEYIPELLESNASLTDLTRRINSPE